MQGSNFTKPHYRQRRGVSKDRYTGLHIQVKEYEGVPKSRLMKEYLY